MPFANWLLLSKVGKLWKETATTGRHIARRMSAANLSPVQSGTEFWSGEDDR